MKRLIVWSLFVVSMLAISVLADAQVQTKITGFQSNQSYYSRNTPGSGGNVAPNFYGGLTGIFAPTTTGNSAFDKNQAYWNSRTRLKIDAVAGKELSGTIFFEMNSTNWGDTDGGNARNRMGYLDGDRANVLVKNVYVDVGLPYFGIPVPVTMRVGLQPFALRPDEVQDCDAMGITFNIKADPFTIIPMYFKGYEGQIATSDDLDFYGLEVKYNYQKLTFGGVFLYQDAQSYPTQATTVLPYGTRSNYSAKVGWYGLYVDGKLGPFDLKADLFTDQGKVYARTNPSEPDVKMQGWVGRLTMAYPIDKLTIAGTFMYATGPDADKVNNEGYSKNGGSKNEGYAVPIGAAGNWSDNLSLFYNDSVMHSGLTWKTDSTNYMNRGYLGGTWAANARAIYPIMPWYKATFGVMYIGDTTKHGNTVGNARKADKVSLRDDKTIGWELALINEFQVYKNLKFNVLLGWLFAGDGMDQWDGAKNRTMKDPYVLGTRLIYSF